MTFGEKRVFFFTKPRSNSFPLQTAPTSFTPSRERFLMASIAPQGREEGTRGLLEQLANELAREQTSTKK